MTECRSLHKSIADKGLYDLCTLNLPGISENMRMHSLKPSLGVRRSSLSCSRIAKPTKMGKEQFPRSIVSHR